MGSNLILKNKRLALTHHIWVIKLFEASEPERNKGRIWLKKPTVWLVGKSQWNRTFEAYNCVHPHSKIGILSALKRRWYGRSLWNNCPHVFQSIQKQICKRVWCRILPSIMRYSTSMKSIQITVVLKLAWMLTDECRTAEFDEHRTANSNTHKYEHTFTLITHWWMVWLCVINSNGMEIYLGVDPLDMCLGVFYPSILFGKKINNYILSRIFRHFFYQHEYDAIYLKYIYNVLLLKIEWKRAFK